MLARSKHSHTPRSSHSPLPSLPARPPSRPGTPRSRSRMTQTAQMPTPTQRKSRQPRRGRGRSNQRTDANSEERDDSGSDDQALLDLLGVASPHIESVQDARGLLRLPADGMDAARGKARSKQPLNGDVEHDANGAASDSQTARRQRTSRNPNADEVDGAASDNQQPRRSKRIKQRQAGGPVLVQADGTQRRGRTSKKPIANGALAPVTLPDADSMDLSSLSRSLPTGGFTKPQAQAKDQSAVWDMPVNANGVQELTWQQRLQAEDTPSKRTSNRSTPNAKNRKGAVAQSQTAHPGMHARRASLDSVPTRSAPAASTGPNTNSHASAPANLPISTFDSYIPFHTGYNVHRAPQTPAKTAGRTAPAAAVPVLGEFPRIKSAPGLSSSSGQSTPNKGPLGIRYAGPTFHNSPHADSLPKPDLDDF
ncbi:hypothetical protein Q5752_000620 [Cryptotrichosporon argae]